MKRRPLPTGRTSAGIVAALVIAAGTGPGATLQAQDLEQSAFVSVIRGGEPVLDLTADEFVVEEDGQRRNVLSAELADVPVQVAILVDDSPEIGRNLSHVRNGLTALIDNLPDGGHIAFLKFGQELTTVVDYTTEKDAVRAAAAEFAPFSYESSYLLNAIFQTTDDLDRRGAIRPIIVLLTADSSQARHWRTHGLGYDVVLDGLREARVAVHSVIVRGFEDKSTAQFTVPPGARETFTLPLLGSGDRDRLALFEQLPKVTGGRREELSVTSAIEKTMTRIADEISNQYLVTYTRPVGLDPPEKTEVKVTRRRHQVRSTPARPLER